MPAAGLHAHSNRGSVSAVTSTESTSLAGLGTPFALARTLKRVAQTRVELLVDYVHNSDSYGAEEPGRDHERARLPP
jgi:hypothetical protein